MARTILRATLTRRSGRYPDPKFRRVIQETHDSNRRIAFNNLTELIASQGVRTGELLGSLGSYLTGEGFALTSDVPQAWYREYGTGIYGPLGRPYWILPLPERERKARAEYQLAKAYRESQGSWPAGTRRNPHAYLRWFNNGQPIFATQVLAPGMRPEPSFGPALFGNADRYEDNYARAIVRTWRRD